MKMPPLAERQQPGLSVTLTHLKSAVTCQSCGIAGTAGLQRWRECDEWDKPTRSIVVLCDRCTKKLINAHPRLYVQLDLNEPAPGCMPLCVGCIHRDGNDCTHADLKANGGEGLTLTFPHPTVMFITCTPRRFGGNHRIYPGPVSACKGRRIMRLEMYLPEVADG